MYMYFIASMQNSWYKVEVKKMKKEDPTKPHDKGFMKNLWELSSDSTKLPFTTAAEEDMVRFKVEQKQYKREQKVLSKDRPKRPSSSFFYFSATKRAAIKSENPGIKVTEISKKVHGAPIACG